MAQKLTDALGQSLVVENRGGAGGTIASDIASKSTPDGYTLLWSSVTTHGVGPVLYTKLPYDALRDFTHIGLAASLPMAPQQYTAFIRAEIGKWGPVVKSSGAKVD